MSLEKGLWSNLQEDMLDIILSRIPLFYHPRFASVCKNWNAFCAHKLYPIDQTDPLLIHLENWKSGFIHYYSPFWNTTFKVKSPIASQESRFFSSKDGWLVLYKKVLEEKEEVEVVLINPTTDDSYSYPGLLCDYFFSGITFSGCPGTKDFVIFGITSQECIDESVRICLWKEGKWKLNYIVYDNQSPFSMSPDSNPVEFKGTFCCVSGSGRLGVFILENETWNILPKPKRFPTTTFSKELYLIESKDKIRVVAGGDQVFYLDCKQMLWRKIETLNGCSMFVGPKSSLMINFDKKEEGGIIKDVRKKVDTDKKIANFKEKLDVNGKSMNNKVYSTRFYGNIGVVEAEMKISDGKLFFVTQACDPRKSKYLSREGSIESFSLQQKYKIRDKYCGSSSPIYCAWYRPEISYGLQGQKIEK